MPAFTHLCSTLSISLAHNVITLYTASAFEEEKIETTLWKMKRKNAFRELGGLHEYIYFDQPDHEYYHDDHFDRKCYHAHIKFPFRLNEKNLIKVLEIFCTYNLIKPDESRAFMSTYRQAINDSEEIFTNALSTIKSKIEKLEKKTLENPEAFAHPLNIAKSLFNKVNKSFANYQANKSLQFYLQLTHACDKEIRKAREALKNYNGWKPASTESTACCSSTSPVSFFKPNKKIIALEEARKQLLRI